MTSALMTFKSIKKYQAWYFLGLVGLFLSAQVRADNLVLLPEKQLVSSLKSIQDLSFNQALEQAQTLAKDMPKYKLAQLLKADLYAIKAGKATWVKQQRKAHQQKSEALLAEAQVRWQKVQLDKMQSEKTLFAEYVIKASDEPFLVIVSSKTHRLHLYQKQALGFEEVANYYVSIGRKGTGKQVQGDKKTPIGIYQIVEELADSKLPELYGVAALTLNYPNSWDKQKGRTGYGIWLHGTPRNTYSRPPLASRGCVVLNNPAMQALISKYRLHPETPVIITAGTADEWFHELDEQAALSKQQVLSQVNTWLQQQSLYQVDWAKVSVYAYPGEKGMYYVRFPVHNGHLIEQYWRREHSGHWQVVYESHVKPVHKGVIASL